MQIIIDDSAGFCFGVRKSIEIAEKEISNSGNLICLGELIHNEDEIRRLESKGLQTIDYNEFKNLKNTKVLLRAHGEPPLTYEIAQKNNITLVDATCPIVSSLQKKIKASYEALKPLEGQIVIYGKKNHPETIGLNGFCENNAIIIESFDDVDKIDFFKPIAIFSQTTMSAETYEKICEIIKNKAQNQLIINKSACLQVANRNKNLEKFCKHNDVIIFVSGKNSSNGKYLFNQAKTYNNNSYFISNPSEIQKEWFDGAQKVGISGATSTPRWLLEEVKSYIENLFRN